MCKLGDWKNMILKELRFNCIIQKRDFFRRIGEQFIERIEGKRKQDEKYLLK